MARIPQSHDLDDQGHQALDKTVLETFNLHVEFNREPKWASLLSTIVNNDARLPERESSRMPVLQKGWINRSFREVRRLGMSPYSVPSDYCR
jgi:hypothetical protein